MEEYHQRVRPVPTKPGAKVGKYGNKKVFVDGIKFDSKLEASDYLKLKPLEVAGAIRKLELQVVHKLEINGTCFCRYRADFMYEEKIPGTEQWAQVCHDSKGFQTPEFIIKWKAMKAQHPTWIFRLTKERKVNPYGRRRR